MDPDIDLLFKIAADRRFKTDDKLSDIEVLELIAERNGVDLYKVRNSSQQTILHFAAGYGRKVTKDLIRFGADVNAQDINGVVPLHNACNHAHKEVAKLLIKNGADVNIANKKGWTALHYALCRVDNAEKVIKIYWEVVELLLNHGADPYMKTLSGKDCFIRIKDRKQRIEVRILHLFYHLNKLGEEDNVAREATIDRHLSRRDYFELIKEGDSQLDLITKLTTRRLVNCRLTNEQCHNISPLHRAAGYNQMETAKYLIKIGADVNAEDNFGRIPLHNAAEYGNVCMIELLIKEGSDIDRTDLDNQSPLHLAAGNRTHHACLELLNYNANRQIRSKSGKLPVDMATSAEVRKLLSSTSQQDFRIYHEKPEEFYYDPSEAKDPLKRLLDYLDETIDCNNTSDGIKRIILSEQGWRYRLVKEKMLSTIEFHIGVSGRYSSYEILSIELLLHPKVWKGYKHMCIILESKGEIRNEKLLFHGSSHIDKIVNDGFDERYAQRKGMFGAALYFADHSSKSNQYTFGINNGCLEHKDKSCLICVRKMICAIVALGSSLTTKEELQDLAHPPPGFSSVAGEPGPNLRFPDYAFEILGLVSADTAADHLEFARKLLSAGKYSDALPHYHEAINNDPSNYLTYFKRATVFLALNRPNSALEDLNKALELNPKFTSALSQRAGLLVKMGNLDEAHIDYEKLIKLEPENSDNLLMYNRIEKLKDEIMNAQDLVQDYQYDVALNVIVPLIEVMPFNTELLRMRAQAFEKVGELRRAITDYRNIAKLSIDTATYLTIAKLCYKLGEIEESLSNVRECLKLDPDHKSCMEFYKPTKKLNNHIQNMLSSKDSKDNDDCYTQGKNALKLLKSAPGQLALIYSIQSVMCRCLSRAGDLQDGLKICTEAIENSKEGGIEGIAIDKPDVICDKADLLADKEDYTEALSLYQESNKLKQSKRAQEGAAKMKKMQKQKKKRDYYKILGVKRGADEGEINRAYRKLAAKWHPDRHQDEESKKLAQAKFMDIADAKAVLTDPEKRQQYDRGEDPLDPESKQQHAHQGFYGDPFGHFGGAPFTFKFNFN